MPFSKKSKETPKRQSERHPVVKPDLATRHVPYGFTSANANMYAHALLVV